MGYQFNPLTGNLDLVGGGGNPFDQDLNTTNNVQFNQLKVQGTTTENPGTIPVPTTIFPNTNSDNSYIKTGGISFTDGADAAGSAGANGISGGQGGDFSWGLSPTGVSFQNGDTSTTFIAGQIAYTPSGGTQKTYALPPASGTLATTESITFPVTSVNGATGAVTFDAALLITAGWINIVNNAGDLDVPQITSGYWSLQSGTLGTTSAVYVPNQNSDPNQKVYYSTTDNRWHLVAVDAGSAYSEYTTSNSSGYPANFTITGVSNNDGNTYTRSITFTHGSTVAPLNSISSAGTSRYAARLDHVHANINAGGLVGTLNAAQLPATAVTTTGTQTLTNKTISSSQITGLGTASGKDIPATGNASSTQVVYGSDTRLTDARTPVSHTHPLSDLTQSSATTGQVATWNGTTWVATTPSVTTDASALTSGTLGDARLSSNVTLLTSTQTLTNKTLTTPSVGNGTVNAILTAHTANILSVSNSTTACGFSIFNTRTDASNYESGIFDFTTNANSLTIGTTKAGTGTARRVRINSAEQIDFYCTDTSRMFQVSTSTVTAFNSFGFQWFSSASDPTTSSTPFSNGSSYCAVYKNTTSGIVSLWVRDGSTMKKVALA
jgi:hypothetical protein